MESDKTPNKAGGSVTTVDATPITARHGRHLLVFSGESTWMVPLPAEGELTIGRSETVEVRLPDPSISRQHARIRVSGDLVTVCDLGSQNGTSVNRERLIGERDLQPGDIVTINRSTLILHAPAPLPHVILDSESLRQRLEHELERALRYGRSFSVLSLHWPDAPQERAAMERAAEAVLRRIDGFTWVHDQLAHVFLAETPRSDLNAVIARLRARCGDAALAIGHASFPGDGADIDALLASADLAALSGSAGETIGASRRHQTLTVGDARVIVADPEMVRLYALVHRLAAVDLPVLITGETGAGKELVASAVHFGSPRRGEPMRSLNCAAIAETLVESELFGHERGAFSGAVVTRVGLVEAADRSTLFLDEIAELSLSAQAKLLRVLETNRLVRVGDVDEREVDVRIVAATNRNLEAEVDAGRFRQDLYFRLSGAPLFVPPLRERHQELPLLAQVFMDEACVQAGRGAMRVAPSAMRELLAHRWPGNVRELKNTMRYLAAAFTDDELTDVHVRSRLQPRVRQPSPPLGIPPVTEADEPQAFRPLHDEIRELEMMRMRAALDASGGNQTRAAQLLSMPVRTFSDKAKHYGLQRRKRE